MEAQGLVMRPYPTSKASVGATGHEHEQPMSKFLLLGGLCRGGKQGPTAGAAMGPSSIHFKTPPAGEAQPAWPGAVARIAVSRTSGGWNLLTSEQ